MLYDNVMQYVYVISDLKQAHFDLPINSTYLDTTKISLTDNLAPKGPPHAVYC